MFVKWSFAPVAWGKEKPAKCFIPPCLGGKKMGVLPRLSVRPVP
jgi:hypothetical protein